MVGVLLADAEAYEGEVLARPSSAEGGKLPQALVRFAHKDAEVATLPTHRTNHTHVYILHSRVMK